MNFARSALMGTAVVASFVVAAPAGADIVLSELIVELQPGKQTRDDIEVWNNSSDRAFVAVEPREIINPGLPGQSARQDPDPEKFGILVNPARMILEGGQRKLIRIAAITGAPPDWKLIGYLCLGWPEEEHAVPELVRAGWERDPRLTERD